MKYKNIKITVVGLGYVGLPLASALSNYYDVAGYDTSKKKILELKKGIDTTNQLKINEINNKRLIFTNNPSKIATMSKYHIVVKERIPLNVGQNETNLRYLQTKVSKSGHLI